MVVLGGARYLNVFKVEQLQALALMFLNLYGQCFNISFVFFGFYCLLIGYLILRSSFLPRILGAGMALAGSGWLIFLSPALAKACVALQYCRRPRGGALTLWLIVAGVNAQRWKEQASAARASIRWKARSTPDMGSTPAQRWRKRPQSSYRGRVTGKPGSVKIENLATTKRYQFIYKSRPFQS